MQGLNELLAGVNESFAFIIPELILCTGIIVLLLAGLVIRKNSLLFNILALLTTLSSLCYILAYGVDSNIELFNNMLLRDGFGEFLMLLVDISVVITCLMSFRPADDRHLSEYYAMILSIAAGCHFLLMSSNLLMLFLNVI